MLTVFEDSKKANMLTLINNRILDPAGRTLVHHKPQPGSFSGRPEIDRSALRDLLLDSLPGDAVVSDERVFGVSSNFFIVTVRARHGDTVAQARALLKRTQGAWPTVILQTLE